jgi:hypothetical protein
MIDLLMNIIVAMSKYFDFIYIYICNSKKQS